MAVPLSWGHIMKGNLATSPPHLFRELLRPSELTLKDPKMYCGFMSQPQALLHLMGGPIAGFLSRPRSRLWGEKKPRGVLESRAQAVVQGYGFTLGTGTPGTRLWAQNQLWAWAALEQFRLVCWKFGFHIFSSFCTPLSTLGIT